MSRGQFWTDSEQKLLAEHWPMRGMGCADMFPNHSPGAVKVRAYLLGLRFVGNRTYPNPWAPKGKPSRSAGSGQITPLSYRSQLCRERLEALK